MIREVCVSTCPECVYDELKLSWKIRLRSTSSMDVFFLRRERPPGCFEAETMKLIPWSTKAPADCTELQPQQRIFPFPLHPALFLYPSLFFHMMLSHNAVKRSI